MAEHDTAPPLGRDEGRRQAPPRVDGYERVSGTAVYPLDVALPDMLYAAILRCPHGHAQVKSVDTSRRRERCRASRAVLTGDRPGAEAALVLRAEKGRSSRSFDPHCRFEGEEVAAVAAETPQQAWDAVRAIAVEYEVLPSVVDWKRR